jgi:hypothetical protein
LTGDEIIDSGASFRVFVSRKIAFGFVQQQVDLIAGLNGLAVKGNLIPRKIDPVIRRLDWFSVYVNASGRNPPPGLGPRSQTGF